MRSKRAKEGEEGVARIFTSQSEDSAGSECCNVIAFVPCARPRLDEISAATIETSANMTKHSQVPGPIQKGQPPTLPNLPPCLHHIVEYPPRFMQPRGRWGCKVFKAQTISFTGIPKDAQPGPNRGPTGAQQATNMGPTGKNQ